MPRGRREQPAAARERRAAIEDPAVVLDAALRFLEVRPRSVGEVRRRLTGGGYRSDLVDAAIGRLTELGVVDDAAFARSWIESRDRVRPRGEHALRMELRQKGIDSETIVRTLDERRSEGLARSDGTDTGPLPDELAARRLLARHASALARVTDPRARRQRTYALLARNGFGPEIAAALSRPSVDELDVGD